MIRETDVLTTECRRGRILEYLMNGNVRVDGLELVPPAGWPQPQTTWAMRDGDGNLFVGSIRPGVPAILILRDPTPAEAREEIARVMQELQASGETTSASEALRIALRRLPRHAAVYSAA
jgi:hypothetical protein